MLKFVAHIRICISRLLILGGTVILFASCERETACLADNRDIPAKQTVTLGASLSLAGGSATFSGYPLSETDAESRISRLIVMLVSLDGAGNELFRDWDYAEIASPGASVTFHVRTTSGPKHVYLVANMTISQALSAVFYGQPAFSSKAGYTGALSDFLTLGTAPDGQYRPGSEIAMSGRAALPGQADPWRIEIPVPSTPGAAVSVSGLQATLTRCVAKVLLTCNMAPDKTGGQTGASYVFIRDPQSMESSSLPDDANNDYNGWMDIRDVWFALNNTSRRLNVFQQIRSAGGSTWVEDPNYALSEYLHRENGTYTPITSGNIYADNFVSFGPAELKLPAAIAGTPFSASTGRMRALAYDASHANPDDPDNHYTEGLYCLENTVHNDLPDLSAAEVQSVSRMGSTYVVVAARYVPKYIYDQTLAASGTDVSGQSHATYADALAKLAAVSGVDEDGNSVNYPQGTFFYYHDGTKTRFCTYAGMMKWIELTAGTMNPVTRRDFSEYTAGWGYYTTYITGEHSSVPDEYGRRPLLFKDREGVLRNTYYLLRANILYVPGSNLPTEDLILVNSTRLDWVPRGESQVIVRPQ